MFVRQLICTIGCVLNRAPFNLANSIIYYEFTLNELAHGLLYMIVSAIMITIIMHMKTNNFDSSHLVYWKDLKQLVSSYIHADFQYSLLCRSLVG